jgi:hypothetical protein
MRFKLFAAALLAFSLPALAHADAGPDTSDAPAANGSACSDPSDCSSGFCVSGVCCDTACNEPGSCTDGKHTLAATCATGTCKRTAPISCAPFGCMGATCATRCTTNADCSAGNVCSAGNCLATSVCSADGASVTAPDGTVTSCSPYRCGPSSATCLSLCITDADCADGNKCQTDQKSCVDKNYTGKASADQSDEGSCTYGHASTTAPFLIALALLGLLRRR